MPSQLNDAISYYNLALVFGEKGLLKEAETSYRRAIALKSDYLKAYSNLGCILIKLDKFDEAIKVYQTALAINPNWATLHNNLGQALQAQGKAGDALSAYLTAIALQPDMVLAHYNSGKVWQLEGDHLQAGRCFQRVIELAPDNVSAYSDWGYSLMASGKLDAAMVCFQKVISHQPAFVEAYCKQFLQAEEEKQQIDELQQAKIACAKFLAALQKPFISAEISGYLWQTYVHLGNVLFEYGSYRQAENYYHQALQIEPKTPEIHLKLSRCLAKQKRQNAALMVSYLAKMSFSAAKFAENNASSSTTSLQGIYLSAKEWVTATQFKGAEYVEVCLKDEKSSQEGGFVYEATKLEQSRREKDFSETISEENSNLDKLPESETLELECGGLNCGPCLKRIYQQLSPIYEESGIQVFDKNRSQLCFNLPSTFVTVIPEGRAWVVPQKNYWMICNAIGIISPDNYLLADVSREYPASLPGCHRHDPKKHRIFDIEELAPVEKIDASVAVLSGLSGNVYFHWMVDILPRLNILRQSQIEFSKIDKFLINSIAQPFQRETLSLLGIDSSKIMESDLHPHIQAKKLIVPSFAGDLGWVQPASLKFLRQEFLKQISLQNLTYPERIYISRGKARYRRVLNEEELINYLEKFGFESVTLEEMPVAEQIALFYHAKIVVAPHGSGLTNIIFCQKETKIIELTSPHYVRHYYPVISQLLGLQHYYLIGEAFACYPLRELMYQNPLTEDIKITKSQLEALIKIIDLNNYPTSENTANSMENIVNSQLNAVKLNEQAEAYLKQGKLKEAETICRQALAVQPHSATAHKILGNILQAMGKIEDAKECYKKALVIEPNYAAVYANLGSLAAQEKEWEAAISYYQKAIQLEPKLGAAYRNLAKVWTQLNKPVEAAECWYGAFSLEPDKFTVQECVNLGNTLVCQGKIEHGIFCYEHAVKLNPNLVGVYQNLGEALKREGKLEEAKVYYRKAEEMERKAGNKLELTKANNGAISSQKSINSVAFADAEACIALAEFYSKKGKWLEAIAACQQAISLQPASAAAYKILGKALQFRGQFESAKQCYLKALEIQPNLAEVYANLGSLAAQQESWQEAILYSQKALQINPQLVPVYRNLARVFERTGLAEESVLYTYNALKLEPASGTAEQYLLLGNKLLGQGKIDEAGECYKQAIKLNSNLSPAYHNLGEILSTKEEWEEAIKAYGQAIKVKPDNAGSHYGLAKALSAQKNWQEAVVAYRQAIGFNLKSAEIYHQFGDALSQVENWEEAVSAYGCAIELNPQNFWSHNNLGDALIKLERWEEAVISYNQAIELKADFHWSYYNLGEAFAKQGRWDEAVNAYRQAVKIEPNLPWISQKLGDALRERAMCDLKAALGCYRQAIKEQPEDLQNYHKALEIKPDDSELYLQLGNALAKQGREDGAVIFYQMALQLQPDDAEILRLLEQVSKKKVTQAPKVSLPELRLTSDEKQTQDVRLIAFYLPQYHPIPENDLWWGKGFTEWTNVTKAQPLFQGHYQPHLPTDLGFYDLRVSEVREQQAALAKQYGIYGFCYYYYWFGGKRLLHRPLDEVLETKKPDFPFCICWANENWTRRWDGNDNEILMPQDCSNDEQNQAFAEHILPILLDERYIRVNGAPLLIIYRADLFPNLSKTAEQWRNIFRKNGVGEVHLCFALTFGFDKHPHDVGFDSAVQFPPNNFPVRTIQPAEVGANNFSGKIVDYEDIAIKGVNSQFQDGKVFRTVMTSWDNTARRGKSAYIFLNSTPEIYEVWLRGAIEKTKQVHSGDERLVFINAWNEWAEGAHLEPDLKYGHAYLAATKKALLAQHSWKTSGAIENLVLPYSNQPLVSIIIPVFNQIEYTLRCLASLAENIQPDTLVEILVINDASTDETVQKLTKVSGLQLINNPDNVGFIHSCNRGAKQAKGKYICFLNNDTEVRPDWLESMVRLIEQDEQVGAVGSKLLYPDGTLQEAGGIIWNDASGWNFGRNLNPQAPEYNYVRPVDYCSGASLLVKKEVFQALGGFAVEFSPAYYEDTDLCFAIRNELGLKVMYQPKSEVIHYEGVTSGTSTDRGVKRYQKINEPKFRAKWQQALTSHFASDSDCRDRASIRLAGKQTILVIDSYVPRYDKESGGNRLFQILKIFKELGYHVILAPHDFLQSEPYTSELQEMGVEVLYQFAENKLTLEEQMKSRLSQLDFAWICRPEFNEKYAPLIRQNSHIRIIYDTVDLHYLRLQREAKITPNSASQSKTDWQKIQALELEMARQADMTVTVTQAEQKLLLEQSIFPVEVVPNIHEPYKGKRKSFRERRNILFIGGYYHSPNVDAVLWLCKSIMPKVWQEIPDLVVTLLGSYPPESVQKLASDRVVVPGYIKDVSSYFLSHRVFVAPLRYGAGMKGKVGQSLEYGLPIVSTTIGVEGMNLRHEENVLVADTAEELATQIIRLYRDENLWNKIADGADKSIAAYSPETVKISIDSLLKQFTM